MTMRGFVWCLLAAACSPNAPEHAPLDRVFSWSLDGTRARGNHVWQVRWQEGVISFVSEVPSSTAGRSVVYQDIDTGRHLVTHALSEVPAEDITVVLAIDTDLSRALSHRADTDGSPCAPRWFVTGPAVASNDRDGVRALAEAQVDAVLVRFNESAPISCVALQEAFKQETRAIATGSPSVILDALARCRVEGVLTTIAVPYRYTALPTPLRTRVLTRGISDNVLGLLGVEQAIGAIAVWYHADFVATDAEEHRIRFRGGRRCQTGL